VILPVQVTFRNMEPTPDVEPLVQKEAAKLDTYYPRITSCRVVVEAPHHRYRSTNPYHVRIDLGVPGEELVVKHQPSLHSSMKQFRETKRVKRLEVNKRYKHLHATISDAFRAARRQLEDFARRQRGEEKTPIRAPKGRVIKIMPKKGFGFLETPDGREIYFHKESVLNNGFGRLRVGTEVIFSEEAGEKGPQASTVKLARQREMLRPDNRARKML